MSANEVAPNEVAPNALQKPPPSLPKILVTGALLLALAGISFGLTYVHLGRAGLPVALLIAAAKLTLVVSIFMELGREKASVKGSAIAAIVLIGLLIAFVLADIATRTGG